MSDGIFIDHYRENVDQIRTYKKQAVAYKLRSIHITSYF